MVEPSARAATGSAGSRERRKTWLVIGPRMIGRPRERDPSARGGALLPGHRDRDLALPLALAGAVRGEGRVVPDRHGRRARRPGLGDHQEAWLWRERSLCPRPR